MGLFKKVKEILFDEEEYTSQIKITPEMRNEEDVKPVKKVEPIKREEPVMQRPTEVSKSAEPVRQVSTPKKESVSERELFKSDTNAFPFFDFDEKEFEQNKPKRRVEPQRPTVSQSVSRTSNVLEYEKKKKVERKYDYGRYEKTEIMETTERKKFKPSPVISPVYGILNQDYQKDDIQKRENIDINEVRNRAFGETKPEKKEEPEKTVVYEETETVTIADPETREKKVKTIDELLEDTSDSVISITDDLENEIDDISNDYEDISKPVEQTKEIKKVVPEETLENDLFDLIDSMYDNKEDE